MAVPKVQVLGYATVMCYMMCKSNLQTGAISELVGVCAGMHACVII
jgi:hypothetical protein